MWIIPQEILNAICEQHLVDLTIFANEAKIFLDILL
jgi:hypothetical protein